MQSVSKTALLWLLLVAVIVTYAQAQSSACSAVPAATSDTSASVVQFQKANAVHDKLCPGMTYTVFLSFPSGPRTWQAFSTKGAFQGASGQCKNMMAGTAAVQKVDSLKLYLGCAATGSVKISIVSKGANDAGLLLKTVSKPIKALSECPSSPCQPPAAPATSTTPPNSPAPAQTPGLNLTGNPMVDMMSVFSMMYGAANAGQNPLGAVLNFNTAMTVIAGLSGLKDRGVEAEGAVKTIQSMLNMVPATGGNAAFVNGMKNFLSVASGYIPTGAESGTVQQQMGGALLDVVSGMAGLAGVAASGNGNSLTSMVPLIRTMSGMSNMMTLLPLIQGGAILPGAVLPAPGSTVPATTTPTTTEAGTAQEPAPTTPTTTNPGITVGEQAGSTTTPITEPVTAPAQEPTTTPTPNTPTPTPTTTGAGEAAGPAQEPTTTPTADPPSGSTPGTQPAP